MKCAPGHCKLAQYFGMYLVGTLVVNPQISWCRFPPGVLPDGSIANLESSQYTKQVDIFAFGLCTLELATRRELDAGNCAIWPQLLALVSDEDARGFIYRCPLLVIRPP